jgi:hypothetical protein
MMMLLLPFEAAGDASVLPAESDAAPPSQEGFQHRIRDSDEGLSISAIQCADEFDTPAEAKCQRGNRMEGLVCRFNYSERNACLNTRNSNAKTVVTPLPSPRW